MMKKLPILSLVIFVFLVSIFSYTAFFVQSEIKKELNEEKEVFFELEVQQLTDATENLFIEYSQVLTASRGLFNASDNVERAEWHLFVDSIELKNNFPSISSFAYIKRVKEKDKDSYITSTRKDTFFSENGFTNFNIFPETTNSDHYIVHYADPIAGSHDLYGFDLTTQSGSLSALELARDTNTVVMSEPILSIKGDQTQKSFLMLLPVYLKNKPIETLDQRRENIEGFILIDSKSNNFIQQILSQQSFIHISSLKINDVTKDVGLFLPETTTMLETSEYNDDDSILRTKVTRRNFYSRTWELDFYSNHTHQLSNVNEYLPYFIFIIGFLVSILVSYSIYNFSSLRYKAEAMSKSLTKDLRKYQLAVQNISEQIVFTDNDGRVLFANPATEKITGYLTNELLGKKAGKLWGGLMTQEYYEELWKIIKVKKETYIGEVKNKRKNGEIYTAEIRISPIKSESGEVEFFVASERDLSDEKKIDNIKNQFIALASHQLRTPLSSMKWNMEMLINGDVGKLLPEQTELTKNIYDSVQRMITLVNSLLSISKIESGKLVIDPKPTNITTLVSEVLDEVKEIALKKKIKIKTNFAPNLAEINLDRTLIKEVYKNLLSNAIKYSNDGGVISLNIKQVDNSIISELIDHGIGIPVADQNSIFVKFRRGSNVLKKDVDGSGLSLYMTKIIIETSNGKIWFDSTEGKGSTFWFNLPIEGYVAKKDTKVIAE